MEVLDRNKRNTALWRMGGLLLFITSLWLTSAWCIHHDSRGIADQWVKAEEDIAAELEACERKRNNLKLLVSEHEYKLSVCNKDQSDDSRIKELEDDLEEAEYELEVVEEDLAACQDQ